jgi:hypothetical protein
LFIVFASASIIYHARKKKKKKKKNRVDLLVEKSLHCVSVAWKRCIMVVLK